MSVTYNTFCRLCGIRSFRLMTIELEFASQIKILFGVQINESDTLSKGTCRNCITTVNNCWIFYQQVLRVQQELTTNCCYQEKVEPLSEDDDPSNNVKIESSEDEIVKPRKSVKCKKVKKTEKRIKAKRKKSCDIEDLEDDSSTLAEDTVSTTVIEDSPIDLSESWPEYPWGCNICGKTFDDEQYYRRHSCFTIHNRYFCADCPKAFKFYNKMISHIKEQHWNRLQAHLLLQCDLCKRWFHSKEEQEFHREQEHPDADLRIVPEMPAHMAKQSFECRDCGKTFANKRYLKQHEPVHSEEKQFICDICGKGFRQGPGLDYHTKKYHTEADQQFHCDQCGKMFPVKKNLEVHMVTHTTERPFVCEICQKTFKTQFAVDLHRTRHANTRKYACKTCGKTYKILRDLQVHTKTHTLDRTHKCSFCEKAFKTKSHLISHERQHTGEQPYSCTVCQRKFTSVGNRLKHMRRIHKICLREKDIYENKEEQMREKLSDVKEESSSCNLANTF